MRSRCVLVILSAGGGLASCGRGGDATSDAMPTPAVTAPLVPSASPPPPTSTVSGAPGLFSPVTAPSTPGVLASASAATIVIGVPALPADLDATRPSVVAVDPGDHDDHEAPPSDGDVATAWVVALYTGRFDEPAGTVEAELAALAPRSVVDAAVASIPPVDTELGEARWPIITAVTDVAGGWWRVEFVLKRTVAGQVGPSTSGPAVVEVEVVAGQVGDWRSVEAVS